MQLEKHGGTVTHPFPVVGTTFIHLTLWRLNGAWLYSMQTNNKKQSHFLGSVPIYFSLWVQHFIYYKKLRFEVTTT